MNMRNLRNFSAFVYDQNFYRWRGRGRDTLSIPSPYKQWLHVPTPTSKCFWKDSLMTPSPHHHTFPPPPPNFDGTKKFISQER